MVEKNILDSLTDQSESAVENLTLMLQEDNLTYREELGNLEEEDSFLEADTTFISTTAGESFQIKTTCYRWLILALLSMTITSISMISISISPVAPVIQKLYGLKSAMLPNLCYILFPLMSVFCSPLAIYLY